MVSTLPLPNWLLGWQRRRVRPSPTIVMSPPMATVSADFERIKVAGVCEFGACNHLLFRRCSYCNVLPRIRLPVPLLVSVNEPAVPSRKTPAYVLGTALVTVRVTAPLTPFSITGVPGVVAWVLRAPSVKLLPLSWTAPVLPDPKTRLALEPRAAPLPSSKMPAVTVVAPL